MIKLVDKNGDGKINQLQFCVMMGDRHSSLPPPHYPGYLMRRGREMVGIPNIRSVADYQYYFSVTKFDQN